MSIPLLPDHLRRFFVAVILLAACCLPASGAAAASPEACAAPLSIDISSLKPFLDTLSPDEKDEQLRDWALYGLKSSLSLGEDEEMPVRHPALKASQPGEISPGRVFPISRTQWGILVAPEQVGNKALLGGLIDRENATGNTLPEKISLFTFTADLASGGLSIACAGAFDAADLFTPEYGYHSAVVSTLADLNSFMARIDDLVSVSWQSRHLVLGGRKYSQGANRSLTVQDVAALYQAYNPPSVDRVKLEKMVRQRYAELLKTDARLQSALRRGTMKKAQVLAQLRRQLSPPRSENVGFSLDPMVDYAAFASDIRRMTGSHAAPLQAMDPSLAALFAVHRRELNAAADRLEKHHDLGPFLALRGRCQKSHNDADRRFAATLRYFETQHGYQTARYDGNLQGTSVGMTLFYTDLLAKLWALDYQGLAPKRSIKGFRTMQEIAVPKLDWGYFVRLSNTRLWFGLRSEGFDVFGDKLLFQPAVTRVYAASSDPLSPGKESLPNFQSGAFLGWWDRHYETVAAVEPCYHKLDQIQKWSCALMVLKEKKSRQLDFLQSYPVQRDLDFQTWIKGNPSLAKIGIPFLDRRALGRRTECLPLLSSKDYALMGNVYILSGGVSLASRKDILAKLHKHGTHGGSAASPFDEARPFGSGAPGQAVRKSPAHPKIVAAGPARQAQGLDAKIPAQHAAGGPSAEKPAAGTSQPTTGRHLAAERQAAGKKQVAGKSRAAGDKQATGETQAAGEKPDAGEKQAAGERMSVAGHAENPAGAESLSSSGPYGTFSAEKQPGTIKLKWRKGPSIALHELVASLAALQQVDNQHQRRRGEGIFAGMNDVQAVVRVKEWSVYLVKTGASNNQWMYLGVNPAKLEEYPAQAAAAFPEADIFCARLVSDANASKLAAGKPVIR